MTLRLNPIDMKVGKVEFHVLVVISIKEVIAFSIPRIESGIIWTRKCPVARLSTVEDKDATAVWNLDAGTNPKILK